MVTTLENGEYIVQSRGRLVLAQNAENTISMASDGNDKGVLVRAKKAVIHVSEDKIELRVGESTLVITADKIQVNSKTLPAGAGGAGE